MDKSNAQQLSLILNRPADRIPGWIGFEDEVVVLEIKDGAVTLSKGHVCSTSGSHSGVDNKKNVVVWGEQPFNPDADSADDAHEKCFEITDPNLLSLGDVEALKNPDTAITYFNGIYSPEIAREISTALAA